MSALLPLTSLRQEMDRFFDRLLEPRWEEFPAVGDWMPKLDLTETKDALVVKVEVPGMEAGDVQVSLQEQVLSIKGEKRQEKEDKSEHYHRVERSYGSFTRTVRLPSAVDAEKVTASFKNGLLTVTLPKSAAAKGTAIPIKEAP